MNNRPPTSTLPPSIVQLLQQLRRRIRWYVLLEGLAHGVVWLGCAYWLGLALDYLPMTVGLSEMPRPLRGVLLTLSSFGLVALLLRLVVRRLATRLPDDSLALIFERRFPALEDTLITSVAPAKPADSQGDHELHDAMFSATVAAAATRVRALDLREVFNYRPLVRRILLAALFLSSIGGFFLFAPAACRLWTSRWLLLTDDPWPRRAAIEVLDFPQRQQMVAEGADLVIRVRAAADRPTPPPAVCSILYRTANGERGRVNMSREGEVIDGFQYYRYEGRPFLGMLDDVRFDCVGLDHRVTDFRVRVVPRPRITRVALACELPAYLNQPPRQMDWRPGLTLPVGTVVQFTAQTTKPLRRVEILDATTGRTESVAVDARSEFQYTLPALAETTALQFALIDTDNVTSEQPYRVTLNALEDLPPQLELRLQGIGTAITPQARLPLRGEIVDDYRLRETWFALALPERQIDYRLDFQPAADGTVDQALDLRRQAADPTTPWQIAPGDKVVFNVRATDEYNLSDEPHLGQSDELPLDVVTPNELLAILEARELNLKRRFEQTLSELIETRDGLLKLQTELEPSGDAAAAAPTPSGPRPDSATSDPAESSATPTDSADPAQSLLLLRLRVQRIQQQATKSAQEIQGVVDAFHEVQEELINNRVDTPDRRERLQSRIIEPLSAILDTPYPEWQSTLAQLEQQIASPSDATSSCRSAVQQANDLIFALQQVLDKMLELESFNELIDIVRGILRDQEAIQQETEAERKRQERQLLEE